MPAKQLGFDNDLAPMADCSMPVENKSNVTYLKLPESCEIDISDDMIRSQINQLHANEDVRRDLTFHISAIDAALGSLENRVNVANITIAQLKGGSQ